MKGRIKTILDVYNWIKQLEEESQETIRIMEEKGEARETLSGMSSTVFLMYSTR
jgi:hypothetical protein